MNAHEKADAILLDGRLTILSRDGDAVSAECVGSTGTYRLGYIPAATDWDCTCPAFTKWHRICSHLLALQKVTLPYKPEESR